MTKREMKCKVNARSLSRKKNPNSKTTAEKKYHKTAGRRRVLRGTDTYSSTKIGAGTSYIRRTLPMGILHARNHRTNELMGYSPNGQ